MRSRYTAYALGLVDYILETTHPDGAAWETDQAAWRASVLAFSRETLFLRLEVLDASESGDTGSVSFRAHLQQAGKSVVMEEHSLFRRHGGRWCYVSAQ
jgi:SEC-C motif-containing protein